ncbi:hemolymph lipopolysaccharide-binding protein [Anabrus simplex]|uniref:hemolymph lipopolysaccharide-binding protein n=1 Tax=Anabrus simplex TaxID=316456 RepID=UPI0035A3D086
MRFIEYIRLLLFVTNLLGGEGAEQCDETAGEVHFTVNSVRNVTGHRTVTANLLSRYSRGQGQNGTGLDVHHTWGRCADTQYERLATITTSTSSTSTSLSARPFPAGYEHFPGVGYYKLYTAPFKSWGDAQQFCQSDGGNLMVVNSEFEAEVIRKFYSRKIPALESAGSWIGFHDQFKPGYYVTVFGETLSKAGYDKWDSGQPDNSKHCGYSYRQGLLRTWKCEAHLPFVCEFLTDK